MTPLLSLARRIIAVNSTGPAGTVALARFVGARLKHLGFSVTLQKRLIKGVSQTNLIARIGPKGASPLLINTHLDTVVTDRYRWSKTGGNPFRAVIRGGYLYGLGSADTKTALASQICALESLDLTKLKQPLFLTGTFAEETGMVGMRELIRSQCLRKIRYALNSEPTELRPVIGHHGFRVYRIEVEWRGRRGGGKIHEKIFRGRAAHSAKPGLGRNAIVDCLRWIVKNSARYGVVEMEGGLEANIVAPFCRIKFVSGKTEAKHLLSLLQFIELSGKSGQTHNIGVIQFRKGRLIVKMDHRFPAGKNPDFRLKYLKTILNQAARKKGLKWRLQIERDNPAFSQPARSRLVAQVMRSLGGRPSLLKRPGCSEAGYLAQIADEVVTIGPGVAYGNAHQPNERVKVAELEEAVEFYRGIIGRLCL